MTTQSGREVVAGAVRRPVNVHLEATSSIHNDETARALGFRGGTIAGSYHMEQFVPLLVDVFGENWFETGCLSLYFRHATVDGEPVQAFAERPDVAGEPSQVRVWMHTEDERVVCDGTASVGAPQEPTALAERVVSSDPGQLRILADLRPGDRVDVGEVPLDGGSQLERVRAGAITEPLPWYADDSPWGPPVATPVSAVRLLFESVKEDIARRRGPGVGLYGAIDLRYLSGPLLLGRSYRVTGEIVAVGSTPKTEYFWIDTTASDGERPVASLRMMSRIMKASSELYA